MEEEEEDMEEEEGMESNEKTKRNINPGFKGSISEKDGETNREEKGGMESNEKKKENITLEYKGNISGKMDPETTRKIFRERFSEMSKEEIVKATDAYIKACASGTKRRKVVELRDDMLEWKSKKEKLMEATNAREGAERGKKMPNDPIDEMPLSVWREQDKIKKCEEKKRAENDEERSKFAVGIAVDNEGREHDARVKVPETDKQIAPGGAGSEGTSKRARPGGQKAKSSNIDPEVIKSLYRKRYPQMTNEQVVKATKTYIEQTRGKVRKGETSAYEEQMRRQEMLKQEILRQQIQVSDEHLYGIVRLMIQIISHFVC